METTHLKDLSLETLIAVRQILIEKKRDSFNFETREEISEKIIILDKEIEDKIELIIFKNN